MRTKYFLSGMFLAILWLLSLQSQATDPAVQLYERLFSKEKTDYKKLFHTSFLSQVPEKKIVEFVALYHENVGDYVSCIQKEAGKYDLIFKRGKVPSVIAFNSSQQITTLWLGYWTLYDDTIDKVMAEFKKLEGTVAVTLIKNGKELISHNSELPLGVGSAFKLIVLKALEEKKKEGECSDETVVALDSSKFSIPSGFLQSWPDRTPVTLKTLANLMISISDNTATDALIYFLGRDYVEKFAPAETKPFLTTMDMFRIKWAISNKEQKEYLRAGIEEKRKLLEKYQRFSNKDIQLNMEKPCLIDKVEWHISTRKLCEILYDMRENSSISINPGLVKKSSWWKAGYKGGSEPGVLNYTHILQKTEKSDIYLLSTTINNPVKEVQTEGFTELVLRLISLIEEGKI